MADTIGDMIDKLTIANVRLWHIEDERRAFRGTQAGSQTSAADAAEAAKVAAKAQALLDAVANVNKERNSLIDQINAALAVLVAKAAGRDATLQLTAEELLGTGKNKFYKTENY